MAADRQDVFEARTAPFQYVFSLGIWGTLSLLALIAGYGISGSMQAAAFAAAVGAFHTAWLRAVMVRIEDGTLTHRSLFGGTRSIAWRT